MAFVIDTESSRRFMDLVVDGETYRIPLFATMEDARALYEGVKTGKDGGLTDDGGYRFALNFVERVREWTGLDLAGMPSSTVAALIDEWGKQAAGAEPGE